MTLKQLWYGTNLVWKLPKDKQYTKCTRCNRMGCDSPNLTHHLKFIAWLHWYNFNPKRLYKRFKYWITDFNYSKIDDIEVDGIDYRDAPDFCDAFISSATYKGKEMSESQLERLNDNSSFVYECVQEKLY